MEMLEEALARAANPDEAGVGSGAVGSHAV